MKQAKQSSALRRTCGNCDWTLRSKSDANQVVCVAHLKIMPVDHSGECDHYRQTATCYRTQHKK
ncbi:MAG: hypothetical protein A2Z95_04350 [Gallionellales bacterium GWA2_60_18]|nr:MAG: hypothetical protein A2Z95_04350 [Gallionellales bacterium GWA2_60_18]